MYVIDEADVLEESCVEKGSTDFPTSRLKIDGGMSSSSVIGRAPVDRAVGIQWASRVTALSCSVGRLRRSGKGNGWMDRWMDGWREG